MRNATTWFTHHIKRTPGAREAEHASTPLLSSASRCIVSLATVSFFAVVLAFFLIHPAVCTGEIDWSLGPEVAKKPLKLELSPLELGNVNDIWAQVISSSYGVTGEFVRSLYDRNYDFDEIAVMMEVARDSKKDPSEIAVLRRKGLGWGAIAQRFGIHPAAMEKAKGKDSLFRRYVLAKCLAGYYGIPSSDALVLLNEKGYGFGEIAVAVNVCSHSGAPLRDVVAARAAGAKWRIVAEKFKMAPAKLGTPPSPRSEGKGKDPAPGKPGEDPKKAKGRTADCSKTCPRKCY